MNAAVAIMLSNYTHDLATGLMFGSVAAYFVAVGVLRRGLEEEQVPGIQALLHHRFRPVVLWSLAAVLALGVPRMIFFEEYEWLPAAGRSQIPALIVKHVFLVGITVTSLVVFLRSTPKIADTKQH